LGVTDLAGDAEALAVNHFALCNRVLRFLWPTVLSPVGYGEREWKVHPDVRGYPDLGLSLRRTASSFICTGIELSAKLLHFCAEPFGGAWAEKDPLKA